MCLLVNCIIYVSTLLSLRVYKPNNPSGRDPGPPRAGRSHGDDVSDRAHLDITCVG